ncbi:MAG: hypothetical protein QGG63_03070, partial [Candidatus Pacebacteria bacterium]|nr:hypothetical protein [Candidatus Paceibacterota bacterium]
GTDNNLLGPGSDPVAAQSHYQRALELNPDIQRAKDRLKVLSERSRSSAAESFNTINKANVQKEKIIQEM